MYTAIQDLSQIQRTVTILEPLCFMDEHVLAQKFAASEALLQINGFTSPKQDAPVFFNFEAIAQRVNNGFLSAIAQGIAAGFKNVELDVVLGVETAAALLVDNISASLNLRATLAQANENGKPQARLRPNSEIKKRENVLIVHDFAITGKNLANLLSLVKQVKAIVAGIGLFAIKDKTVLEQLSMFCPNIYALVQMNARRLPN